MQNDIAVGFSYIVEHMRGDEVLSVDMAHNLVPVEGLNYLINAALKAGTQETTWYVAPFEGNYTPTSGVTAATVVALSTESTAYDEANRVVWAGGSVSAGAVDNSATPAEFTFNATKSIYGAFVISNATKGNGTGTLVSVVRFSTVKNVESGDVLKITAGFMAGSV